MTTCTELVGALRLAGLGRFALEGVAGNGFVPGVTSADQLADPAHPCRGAVPRRHSHFFTQDGRFGSLDWNREQVDDGTYRLAGDRTVVVDKEFPRVTFRYRIRGDTIVFEPVIPKRCSSFRCAWAVSMAYPGKAFKRVNGAGTGRLESGTKRVSPLRHDARGEVARPDSRRGRDNRPW